MKNKIIILLIFIIPILLYSVFSYSLNKSAMTGEYALAADMPTVIMFSTPMCGECHKMAPVFDKASKTYDGKIKFIKINPLKGDSSVNFLVKKHTVRVVPTLIYLDKSGNSVTKAEGFMPYEKFDLLLKDLINE